MFPLIRTLTKYIFLNKTYCLNELYLHKDKKYPLGWAGGIYKNPIYR